jgi:hypothetical protein
VWYSFICTRGFEINAGLASNWACCTCNWETIPTGCCCLLCLLYVVCCLVEATSQRLRRQTTHALNKAGSWRPQNPLPFCFFVTSFVVCWSRRRTCSHGNLRSTSSPLLQLQQQPRVERQSAAAITSRCCWRDQSTPLLGIKRPCLHANRPYQCFRVSGLLSVCSGITAVCSGSGSSVDTR